MVNLLFSSIIIYEALHKPTSMGNYVQSDNNWEDNEMFFTDRQYRRDEIMRGQYRSAPYTP